MAKFTNIFSGLIGLFKNNDFSKGFDEAGGADGIMIYARGGGAGDVKAYRAAKDHYNAVQASAAVDGQGEFLRDANGNLVPERNPDGSVRRELIPTRFDANGNPIEFREGNIIYQRGGRRPTAGGWNIR